MTLTLDNRPGSHQRSAGDTYAEIAEAWQRVYGLLMQQQEQGHWSGELSTSALSTATAISGMVLTRKHHCVPEPQKELVDESISAGCHWLAAHQNADGGFGDTDRSHSNIATTLLVLAAWELAGKGDSDFERSIHGQREQAWEYVDANGRWEGLRKRYGKDKTFVVPILSNCALAGLVPWQQVYPLPFEAAWLPQDWYRWARMPVVSYAIPALVAIGQTRFHKCPPRNPLLKRLRRRALAPTLNVLRNMQPASGGYLEAVPLTSFVLMNLAAAGNASLPVAQDCLRFILNSRLADGSWPIDTNLATWLTSLSVSAIARRTSGKLTLQCGFDLDANIISAGDDDTSNAEAENKHGNKVDLQADGKPEISLRTVRWLLSCQHQRRHPFTGATPGGWGWTDLSGAVPDADDTPAALLALHEVDLASPQLQRVRHEVEYAVGSGLRWLLRLQNRDGGWPTFCRGWGKLPFDRSGTDLTAHALRAIQAWLPSVEQLQQTHSGTPSAAEFQSATRRGLRFLARRQQPDGSWMPLWFGNQDRPEEDNPVYGTGKVLQAYAALGLADRPEARRGVQYLVGHQNPDGGWGGGTSLVYTLDGSAVPVYRHSGSAEGHSSGKMQENIENCSSVEETSIALEGLIQCAGNPGGDATIMRGLDWLVCKVGQGAATQASPIGFYFAKLWYYEQLYPTVFSLSALGAALNKLGQARASSANC